MDSQLLIVRFKVTNWYGPQRRNENPVEHLRSNFFAKKVNGSKQKKSFIVGVWLGSKYASGSTTIFPLKTKEPKYQSELKISELKKSNCLRSFKAFSGKATILWTTLTDARKFLGWFQSNKCEVWNNLCSLAYLNSDSHLPTKSVLFPLMETLYKRWKMLFISFKSDFCS